MKKTFRAIGVAFLIIVASLAVVYILLGRYYSTGFPCSTWINGVYCTGKSVSEVNKELVERSIYPGITLYGRDSNTLFIGASEVEFSIDYTDSLNSFLSENNPYAWGLNLFNDISKEFEPTITLNEDKFKAIVLSWDIFPENEEQRISIEKTEEGYILHNGLTNVPNRDNIVATSLSAMKSMEIGVDLTSFDYTYTDYDLTADDEKIIQLFEKIDALQNCKITYDFEGVSIPVDAKAVSDFILTGEDLPDAVGMKSSKKEPWLGMYISGSAEIAMPDDFSKKVSEILDMENEKSLSEIDSTWTVYDGFVLNENGNVILSQTKMHAYFEKLASEYDTEYLMELYRQGIADEIVVNSKKGEGALFDINKAFEELKNAYIDGTYIDEKSIVLSLGNNANKYNALASLGNTYIEVNMNKQMLYYYVDGQLNMDMPVVTGNINRSRGTPTGIFNVYNKRYHTYLRGVDYVSYVNYWLGVNKGVGIHDANWRDEFGGEIYKSSGSHGCINCPEEKVSVLWEVVDVGTPVILYY